MAGGTVRADPYTGGRPTLPQFYSAFGAEVPSNGYGTSPGGKQAGTQAQQGIYNYLMGRENTQPSYTPPAYQPARQHISPFGLGSYGGGFQQPQYSPLQQMQSSYYGNPYRFGSK